MTKTIRYESIPAFARDMKRLRRFAYLAEDLETAKKNAIELFHLRKIDNQSCFPIPGHCTEDIQICKIKKFACRALKGSGCRSGIRVIYAYFQQSVKVVFIEIYYKGDKANEDKERIRNFLREINDKNLC
jgi:hypothetical protein